MTRRILFVSALFVSSFHILSAQVPAAMGTQFARDPHQAVDVKYTEGIAKYTTESFFN